MTSPVSPRIAPRVARVQTDAEPGYRPLLQDAVRDWLATGTGNLAIVGGPGAGKSTAIELLAREFADAGVDFVDGPVAVSPGPRRERRAVYAIPGERPEQRPDPADTLLRLEPWTEDEVLEWLMARCPSACASVWTRASARDGAELGWAGGNPALLGIALEAMQADESVCTPRDAVLGWLRARLAGRAWGRALVRAVWSYSNHRSRAAAEVEHAEEIELVVGLEPVAAALAGSVVAHDLVHDRPRPSVCRPDLIRDDVLDEAARHLREAHPEALPRLQSELASRPEMQPIAASVLFRVFPDWRPPTSASSPLELSGARLVGAAWSGVELPHSHLNGTRLRKADLESADLREVFAVRTDFRRAKLRAADLGQGRFVSATFAGADLRNAWLSLANLGSANLRHARLDGALLRATRLDHADLTGASLRGASCPHASFSQARIDECDFRDCDLFAATLSRADFRSSVVDGASLASAVVDHCVFDGMVLEDVCFRDAWLMKSYWTGARARGADFRGANLAGARLADVDWEGADLRDAVLRGVSFHLGSSRSGLVDSAIAGEGSRTGFYTDDEAEQGFKAPEEIRKANLRGADLRGAKIRGTDFYLVDLRDARLDPDQRALLTRMQAIL